MSQLDVLLSVLENPTRRRILQALVREPHYPLQLSKELRISQQTVMKHLKVLEEHNLVKCYKESSDLGGPMRKIYVPNMKFSLVIDVGPGLFNVEVVDFGKSERTGDHPGEQVVSKTQMGLAGRIRELRDLVARIDRELNELQSKRADLIRLKEKVLMKARQLVEEQIDEYQIRKIIYEYIHNPDMDIEELARTLSIRDEVVKETLEDISRGGDICGTESG